jgi:hypothetical protein
LLAESRLLAALVKTVWSVVKSPFLVVRPTFKVDQWSLAAASVLNAVVM